MKIFRIANPIPKFNEGDKIQATIKGMSYVGTIDSSEQWDENDFRYYINFQKFKELEQSQNEKEQEIADIMQNEIREQNIKLIEKSENWDKTDTNLNLKDKEIFNFGTRSWDVRYAKRIIYKNPREIKQYDVNRSKYLLNGMINTGGKWEQADLNIPIILITTEQGEFPIDGWHRIKKAIENNIITLPSITLTIEESKEIEL